MVQEPVRESVTMRSILIIGGGTAGWLAAAYLARFLGLEGDHGPAITLLESPEIGTIGVGEGAFPTIRATLGFLGIDETRFIRTASATFKQGIRFDDWLHAPTDGKRHSYIHPFEPPFHVEGLDLAAQWLRQDPATRPPFAEAVTIQHRVAMAGRAPKQAGEGAFDGPLSYAYHFDAGLLGEVLAERARELGVRHLRGRLDLAILTPDGAIDHVVTPEHGALSADLYIDCTGLRAELIGRALETPFQSASSQLFTDRALACKLPYRDADAPIATMTIATAHAAGWTWDIGLAHARGLGVVYSSDHMDDTGALGVLAGYAGCEADALDVRSLSFEPGYRKRQWVRNCVAVGLAGGFLEPLESTGLVLIEAAIAMIAELFPHHGPIDAPAERFNMLMNARYDAITDFLKLHYSLSRREEPFWLENSHPATMSDRLKALLDQWRYRPPNRFDFTLDIESFAYFNYQYILYGMDFAARTKIDDNGSQPERLFHRIHGFAERAAAELPDHRDLIRSITSDG
jgi:glycine/D-amino acid oxidase-like deaminating enzyme